MFWTHGIGRIVRIGAWLAFAACFAFANFLSLTYGEPCPGQENHMSVMICGPRTIGRIGNINTVVGIAFLCLALYATSASRAERRRRKAQEERAAQATDVEPGKLRVKVRKTVNGPHTK